MYRTSTNTVQRNSWTSRYFRGISKNHLETEQDDSRDSDASIPNQREDYSTEDFAQKVKEYKRNSCPTEPFKETLRLLDKLFPRNLQTE
jgi:hypothetical protein